MIVTIVRLYNTDSTQKDCDSKFVEKWPTVDLHPVLCLMPMRVKVKLLTDQKWREPIRSRQLHVVIQEASGIELLRIFPPARITMDGKEIGHDCGTLGDGIAVHRDLLPVNVWKSERQQAGTALYLQNGGFVVWQKAWSPQKSSGVTVKNDRILLTKNIIKKLKIVIVETGTHFGQHWWVSGVDRRSGRFPPAFSSSHRDSQRGKQKPRVWWSRWSPCRPRRGPSKKPLAVSLKMFTATSNTAYLSMQDVKGYCKYTKCHFHKESSLANRNIVCNDDKKFKRLKITKKYI